MPVTGDDEAMAEAFGRLFAWAAEANLVEAVTGLWSIEQNDRRDVAAQQCRAEAMLSFGSGAAPSPLDSIGLAEHGGGRYARVRVVGPYSNLEPALDGLLARWWPESADALASRPILFNYLDDPETTPATLLRTDIHLPLE